MRIDLKNEAATEALGAVMAGLLIRRPAAVVYLEGNLGAGKTTLARGFLRALGVTGSIRSPTYTLMEHYRVGEREMLHLDLYRLNDPTELHNLGLSDFPPDRSFWLLEWPEQGKGYLPPADIQVRLSHAGEGRRVEITGFSGLETVQIEQIAR